MTYNNPDQRNSYLCWADYEFGGLKRFTLYPQYRIGAGNNLEEIDTKDIFPDNGCIRCSITGGMDCVTFNREYGNVLLAEFAIAKLRDNDFYDAEHPTAESSSKYFGLVNPSIPSPDIVVKKLSTHPISYKCHQVVAIDMSFEETISRRKIPAIEQLITSSFFVRTSDNVIFGPLSEQRQTTSDGVSISVSASSGSDYAAYHTDYALIEDRVISITDSHFQNKVIMLPEETVETVRTSGSTIDWISDNDLFTVFSRVLRNQLEWSKSESKKTKDALESLQTIAKSEFTEERKLRLQNIVTGENSKLESIKEYLVGLVHEDVVGDILFAGQKEAIYQQFRDQILSDAEVKNEIEGRRRQCEIDLNNVRGQIEKLKLEEQGLHETLRNKNAELKRLQDEIDNTNDSVSASKTEELKELEDEIERKKTILIDLEEEHRAQLRMIDRLKSELDEYIDSLNDRVVVAAGAMKTDLMQRVLNTVTGVSENLLAETNRVSDKKPDVVDNFSAEDLINAVCEHLSASNRLVQKNEVVNYLTCISIGYITTFAGEPGSGKTSLCNYLAESLGLVNSSRFIEIPVERGWTSHRDFIGYYNPLTKTYEKANGRVFDAFHYLSSEDAGSRIDAPFILLLDEANLSPVEHYWAPFLLACDSFQSKVTQVELGGNKSFCLPENIRFLATVNFDHSTEELSPRFLDRSWVIRLEPVPVDYSQIDHPASLPSTVFSYSQFSDLFSPDEELKIELSEKLDDILTVYNDAKMPVSPRNQLAMLKYMKVAQRYMDTKSKDTKLAPLDYAIAQKLLPTINGFGDRYKKLIEGLLNICGDLPKSKDIVERIRDTADDHLSYYQYFTR